MVTYGRELLAQAPEQLLGVIERQARALLTQQEELMAYQQQVEALQRQVKELEAKAAIGKVAPFRREESKRVGAPKRSGRKGGHQGQWRVCPPPREDDEHIEVLLEECPDCGNALERSGERAIEQTIIEAPVVKARVIRLKTYRNKCEHCHKQVQSRHPLQVSVATGAAGTHLGPRALGLAAALNKDLKLTMRKSCKVLEALLGIELSAGGLSQAMARVAGRLEGEYDKTLEQLRNSEVIHTDETGWWVGGPGYTLWVFTNDDATYYRIALHRTREEAKAVLGEHFKGVLVSDCLNIYDGIDGEQQKCYAHHLKALSEALKSEAGKASSYLLELRTLLHTAMVLKKLQPDLSEDLMQQFRFTVEAKFEKLLGSPRVGDHPQAVQEEKIRMRLYKQQDHLLTFLDYPQVEATNNLAERQLRPAVISRKLSCGNKTDRGATTWAILASLAATCEQRGDSFVEQVAHAMVLDNAA